MPITSTKLTGTALLSFISFSAPAQNQRKKLSVPRLTCFCLNFIFGPNCCFNEPLYYSVSFFANKTRRRRNSLKYRFYWRTVCVLGIGCNTAVAYVFVSRRWEKWLRSGPEVLGGAWQDSAAPGWREEPASRTTTSQERLVLITRGIRCVRLEFTTGNHLQTRKNQRKLGNVGWHPQSLANEHDCYHR